MTSKKPKPDPKKDTPLDQQAIDAKKAARRKRYEELKAFNEQMLEYGRQLNRLFRDNARLKKIKNP
jgi:hypothetical protein